MKVQDTDPLVIDEINYVDKSLPGQYASTVEQAQEACIRKVEHGKIRRDFYAFTSDCCPGIQKGAVCTLKEIGFTDVLVKILTFSHVKGSGKKSTVFETKITAELFGDESAVRTVPVQARGKENPLQAAIEERPVQSDIQGVLSSGEIKSANYDEEARTGFCFTYEGLVKATQGEIGGWEIGAHSLSAGVITFHDDGRITAPYFAVTAAGELSALQGDIGGWSIGTHSLSAGLLALNDDGSLSAPFFLGEHSW